MEDSKRSGQASLWLLNLLGLLEPLDQYIHEVKKIATLEPLAVDEKITRIREASGILSQEMEGRFEALADQLQERKRELENILNPPKPDLRDEVQRLLLEMSVVLDQIALREQLKGRWEAQSSIEILRAYEERLGAGDTVTVEMFEAYAEDILKRKGDEDTLAAFRERSERARESRLTPAQVRARQELQELEKLETFMRLMSLVIASIVKSGRAGSGEDALPAG